MKLTDFLDNVSAKVGKQNEQAIIDILSNANLTNINVADDVANDIIKGLLTVESAKNNSDVKAHFTALALGSMDSEILNAIKTLELSEFEKEISETKSTYEKHRKLFEKIKQANDTLKASQGKGEENEKVQKMLIERADEINRLKKENSEFLKTHVPMSEIKSLKKANEKQLTNYAINHVLSGVNYALTQTPKDVNMQLAKTLIEKELSGKAVVIRDEFGNLKLKRYDDVSLDYYDETNKAVTFSDFANKVLADNSLLAVSDVPEQTSNNPVHKFIQNPNEQKINNSKIVASVNDAIEDLKS